MALFKVGDRISLKENVNHKGEIQFVHPISRNVQYYDILFDDNNESTKAEYEIVNEVKTQSAWSIFASGHLFDHENFKIANTIHKVQNTSANTLSTLKASRTLFKPYQYLPLVKILRSDNRRILIADEVGLGKTIEAGHILLELLSRGEVKNLLVVCSNSLKDKWRNELMYKFNVNCKIHSTSKELISDIESDILSNTRSLFAITNYEKFASKPNKLVEFIEEQGYSFDMIICDEAHKLRNRNNTSMNFNVLAQMSKSLVFMTATPIMTELKNLYNLLSILDNDFINQYEVFFNSIEENKPFVKAISQLNNNIPYKEIAHTLRGQRIGVYTNVEGDLIETGKEDLMQNMSGDEVLTSLLYKLENLEDNAVNRVQLQRQLLELNSLNYIYSRTRKKDVLEESDIVDRDVITINVDLTSQERALYQDLIDEYDDEFSLGLITRKRQISSSIVAFHSEREELKNGGYNEEVYDSKFEHLKNILEANKISGDKLIIFAFFTDTLLYLGCKLKELSIEYELIYGGSENREASILNFKENSQIKVLLSSEVGSEGLDLQFCKAVVNYDLPWNPMIVEQRIGRIDRIGQKNKVINIFNFVLNDTIEHKIYTRLYKRIKLFEASLGAMEEILGELEDGRNFIQKGIQNIYREKLTSQEIEKRLIDMSLAFEREKVNLETISSELSDSLTNDAYFKNEIKNIETNKRFLTENEVENLLRRYLNEEHPYLHFHSLKNKVYKIVGTELEIRGLLEKIKQNLDTLQMNTEVHKIFNLLLIKCHQENSLSITFNQNRAFEDQSIEYINAFHPFVNAITNFYVKSNLHRNQANKLFISRNELSSYDIQNGIYVYVSFNISISKFLNDKLTNEISELKSICLDLNQDEILFLSEEKSSFIGGVMAVSGAPFDDSIQLDFQELTNLLRTPIMMSMKEVKDEVLNYERDLYKSRVGRKVKSEVRYLTNRIKRNESLLREERGIAKIIQSEISNDQMRIDDLNSQIGTAEVKINEHLISINILHVE